MGRTSKVPKTISKATKPVRRKKRAAAPSLSYEEVRRLSNPDFMVEVEAFAALRLG